MTHRLWIASLASLMALVPPVLIAMNIVALERAWFTCFYADLPSRLNAMQSYGADLFDFFALSLRAPVLIGLNLFAPFVVLAFLWARNLNHKRLLAWAIFSALTLLSIYWPESNPPCDRKGDNTAFLIVLFGPFGLFFVVYSLVFGSRR